jgi:hypothetical protein
MIVLGKHSEQLTKLAWLPTLILGLTPSWKLGQIDKDILPHVSILLLLLSVPEFTPILCPVQMLSVTQCMCVYYFCIFHSQLTAGEGERILVMGATNRPQELDDAALRWDKISISWSHCVIDLNHLIKTALSHFRRLVKRVYLPLPDSKVKYWLQFCLYTYINQQH